MLDTRLIRKRTSLKQVVPGITNAAIYASWRPLQSVAASIRSRLWCKPCVNRYTHTPVIEYISRKSMAYVSGSNIACQLRIRSELRSAAIMTTSSLRANFLSFTGRAKILHTTWFAFFVTFLVWFNHAPLLALIQETMGLSDQQIKTLLILNVALTICNGSSYLRLNSDKYPAIIQVD